MPSAVLRDKIEEYIGLVSVKGLNIPPCRATGLVTEVSWT